MPLDNGWMTSNCLWLWHPDLSFLCSWPFSTSYWNSWLPLPMCRTLHLGVLKSICHLLDQSPNDVKTEATSFTANRLKNLHVAICYVFVCSTIFASMCEFTNNLQPTPCAIQTWNCRQFILSGLFGFQLKNEWCCDNICNVSTWMWCFVMFLYHLLWNIVKAHFSPAVLNGTDELLCWLH